MQPVAPALICFSHLRWDFVFQRPQHLMTRCARGRRVYFVEEPIREAAIDPFVEIRQSGAVTVVVPHLPDDMGADHAVSAQQQAVDGLIVAEGLDDYALWYYTPLALLFTAHLRPSSIIYDCMDELSAFKGASPALKALEARLLSRASLVLTGGQSLYEAKRQLHPNIHAFPSSVDVEHFGRTRRLGPEPDDQACIVNPRLGFFGVIDERMDLELLDGVAAARPDWQIVMIGPVVKIDPASLPRRANLHYLGSKTYDELPHYVAGWDVSLLPFARNEATRFISPTKTLEYMAAGVPVVSTSIQDVVRPYGQLGLVRIADKVGEFVSACEAAMDEDGEERGRRAGAFLRQTSWDGTWHRINQLVSACIADDYVSAQATAGSPARGDSTTRSATPYPGQPSGLGI